MPTDRELLEQGAKQIAQINAIVRSQDAKIEKLNKALDEQIKINSELKNQIAKLSKNN